MSAAVVYEVIAGITERGYAATTAAVRLSCLRRLLLWLWAEHGAPKLDGYVPRVPRPRPRNVTASQEQIDALMTGASPRLKLFLLLCNDLAIRSGTAVRLGPEHYDQSQGVLRFKTKFGVAQALPVTQAVRVLLDTCDQSSPVPFVWQLPSARPARRKRWKGVAGWSINLRRELTRLRKRLGIEKRVVPHDLRRTTAVRMLEHTGDLRDVQSLLGHSTLQSTIWYLDHDLVPVKRSTLELIKRPTWAEKRQA